jgi:hypothetical protein
MAEDGACGWSLNDLQAQMLVEEIASRMLTPL